MKKTIWFLLVLISSLRLQAADPAERPLQLKGTPYLNRCVETLAGKVSVAKILVDGIQTPGQMLQALSDYDLIFSSEFRDAFYLLYTERGAPVNGFDLYNESGAPAYGLGNLKPTGRKKDNSKPTGITKEQMMERQTLFEALFSVSDLQGEEMSKASLRLLQITTDLLARTEDESRKKEAQVRYSRAKSFLDAVLASEKAREQLYLVMGELVREISRTAAIRVANNVRLHLTQTAAQRASWITAGSFSALSNILYHLWMTSQDYWLGTYFDWSTFQILVAHAGVSGGIGAGTFILMSLGLDEFMGKKFTKNKFHSLPSQIEVRGYEMVKNQAKGYGPDGLPKRAAATQFKADLLDSGIQYVMRSGVLSIEQACQQPICTLNEAEIASLGHIDFLEIDHLNSELTLALSKTGLSTTLQGVKVTAQKIVEAGDDASSYEQQMSFSMALREFTQNLRGSTENFVSLSEALIKRVSATKKLLSTLIERPYTEIPKSATELHRNSLFIATLKTDLQSLNELEINSEALKTKAESLRKLVAQAEELLVRLPRDPSGWEDAATRTLLQIELMEKL